MNQTARGPIWFGIGLVVIILGIGGWLYFLQPSQGPNVTITLATEPVNVLVGDPFTFSVSFSNDSALTLKNASISLVLPGGVVSVDSPSQQVVTQTVGSVDPGGVSHEDFHLIATGTQNSVLHFTAKVMYGSSDSSAQFEEDNSVNIISGQSAVAVNISAPTNVASGQNFPVTLTYDNESGHAIEGMGVAMQYPPAFTFVSASSSLVTNGNSAWSLGTLQPDATGTLTIKGNLVGPNNASYPISVLLSENISGQNYTIANPTANVVLAASPLTFGIMVNNSQSYISTTGDSLNYVLTFTNNSTVTFESISVSANLIGGMFDFSTLKTAGTFDSITNSVTWNGAASPSLLSLAPGQSGSVNFSILTKSAFPIRLLSDKNYSLTVNGKLSSPTVPPGTSANATISVAALTTKLGGKILLTGKGYWHEPEPLLGFSNSGPYPPKVNVATQYTIHWLLTNYATDADNVNISAYLQPGTTCTGKMKVPASSTLACNPSNGEVTWTIPVVPGATGIADAPLEADFQVTNTPAINQVGQYVTLIGSANLMATDGWTGGNLKASTPSITTELPDDTSISTNGQVVE